MQVRKVVPYGTRCNPETSLGRMVVLPRVVSVGVLEPEESEIVIFFI